MKAKKFFLLMLFGWLCLASSAAKHKYTLVIDAGHGGKDPGTMIKTAKEKTIALNVALAFGRYVEQNCPDVRVIYTRKTDVFIPLHERADIANRNKADVFISIHVNSVASKKPIRGLETYTMGIRRSDEKLSAAQRENDIILIEKDYKQHYAGYDPRSPESSIIFQIINEENMLKSVELASLIQKNVCQTAKRPNGGVKQDAFLVLRETSMPACLVELGYITTPSEVACLTDKNKVDLMAKGLYRAFVAFKNKQKGGGKEPDVAPKEEIREEPQPEPSEKDASPAPLPTVEEKPQTTRPVFKVQILASDRKLKPADARLKGCKEADCYEEGGLWKYTMGSSDNYDSIYQLRKQLLAKFPQAFIIAFRNGEKMNVNEAIREYKKNR